MVPPNLHSIHAKCVTIIPEDIQIALHYLQWKSCKEENKNSICGAELKQNSIHGAELKQNSIHGAELKQNSVCGAELKQRRQENKMMMDEFSASCLTKKTRSNMMKDEFSASYMKKKIVPLLKSRLIDYYQDEERNAIVDDYPNVHTTLWQSSGE